MRMILAIAAAVVCIAHTGYAAEWHVDKKAENQVVFISKVVAFTFEGTTDRIDGYIYWAGDQFFERDTQVRFEVDLGTLDTDNGKRDSDMRGVLETDKWPYAVFEGVSSSIVKIDSTVTAFRVKTKGTISIHGIEKELEVPGLITVEDGRIHLKSRFSIKLSDFDIEAPSLVAFVKVSDEIKIDLDFYLQDVEN